MVIAGHCSYLDKEDEQEIYETAQALSEIRVVNEIDIRFRAKVFCGGTHKDRFFPGIGIDGIPLLDKINKFIPTGTEIQIPAHVNQSINLSYVWIGCRNSQNYALLQYLKYFPRDIFIKRHPGMSNKEFIDLHDLVSYLLNRDDIHMIERGISTIDRTDGVRWSIAMNSLLEIRHDRPDIWERLVVDISHSAGRKEYIGDLYSMCQSIGVNHYMIEVTKSGESRTDGKQMLSIAEFKDMIGVIK